MTPIPFNCETAVRKLLRAIPHEHLLGLDAIIINDRVTHKGHRQAGGIYRPKEGQQPATIEIAVDAIYSGMPRICFFLPFVPTFMLANVLFHELGHHYQRFTHGVTKEAREDFAELYRKQMLQKVFWGWRVLLSPLAPLVRWLSGSTTKRVGQDGSGPNEQEGR